MSQSPRPRLLDLFCCAGGAAVGYDEAGFDVYGVDIDPQPNYPYPMEVRDAMTLPVAFLREFDAIHASPPCQAYSDLAARTGNGDAWPRLIEPVREMLQESGKPYIIENVEGAPLQDYSVLCGTMFPGLRVIRHRLFETSFPMLVPAHRPHPLVHTLDKRKSHYGLTNEWMDYVSVNGGGNCTIAAAKDAMGIPWMTKKEINEAIPPAYTRFVGAALMRHLGMAPQPSVRALLKEYLAAHVGQIVTKDELQAAAKGRTEWARRVRELRTDEGWPIESHNDAADLKPGEYRLTKAPPLPGMYTFGRRISQRQRSRILDRNGYTCQSCGAAAGDYDEYGRPVRLHIGHLEHHIHGGPEDDSNLKAVCASCNQGAKDLTVPPPNWVWLLSQIRRASRDDQIQALGWLRDKFAKEGGDDEEGT